MTYYEWKSCKLNIVTVCSSGFCLALFCLLFWSYLHALISLLMSSSGVYLWFCDFWNKSSVPWKKQNKENQQISFLSYCYVALCHATKEWKWDRQENDNPGGRIIFSLYFWEENTAESRIIIGRLSDLLKKLVINTRQPVTGELHIPHSWSVNKIGEANYSKSLIHTDSRNISWSNTSWQKYFVP